MDRERHRELAPCAGADRASPPLLPLGPLLAFLRDRGLAGDGPIEAVEIGSGHSNPTYLVNQGATELVVRRAPPPPLPPSAHDVLREARVLVAVAGGIPVPRVLAVCEDASLIGAPFFVMEKVDGMVITDALPDTLTGAEDRRRIAWQLIDVLADLHRLDWRARGLSGFGKPTGYLERQLRRLAELWRVNRTRELPELERVGAWLAARMPSSGDASIVHGDYRLGNVMFEERSPARLSAVFDWEMATIGDPLADLGYLAGFWVQPDDPPLRMWELGRATRAGGFPTRQEMVERYEQRSGRGAAGAISWYETLAHYKLAVVMEGNYKRTRAGAINNPYLEGFGDGVVELVRRAAEVAGIRA